MCLAVPMKLVKVAPPFRGTAEIGGVARDIDISLVEGAATGDYVIVHAGFAIARLDQDEAEARLKLFAELLDTQHPTEATPPCAT